MARRSLLSLVVASLCAWACGTPPSTRLHPGTTPKDDSNGPVDPALGHPASPDLANAPQTTHPDLGPSDGGLPSDGDTESGDPCGSVTLDGECDGATLKWCEVGTMTLQTLDCTILGGCTVDSMGFADCVS